MLIVLAPANSIHTYKIVVGLSGKYSSVLLVSLHPIKFSFPRNVVVRYFNLKSFFVINYLFDINSLLSGARSRKIFVHYASSYGFLAWCFRLKRVYLCAWGSDIFEFPNRSLLHRCILEISLKNAERLISTSHVMADEMKKYVYVDSIDVIPFGIDVDFFCKVRDAFPTDKIVIGTVKALEYIYGIDLLIESFAILVNKYKFINVQLQIVGTGSEYNRLLNLAKDLGVVDRVVFHGYMNNTHIPSILEGFHIFIALSRRESFGVSILEAMAMSLPVVVSNADGPSEIVVNGFNGYIVNDGDPVNVAKVIGVLINNENLRLTMGKNGRAYVREKYSWHSALGKMVDLLR